MVIRVAIGVDCDPDRDTGKTFLGIKDLSELLEIRPNLKLTLNIRRDIQIHRYPQICNESFSCLINIGHQIAWHPHYYNAAGFRDMSKTNIDKTLEYKPDFLTEPYTVHSGWIYQNDYTLKRLGELGIICDYSPAPGCCRYHPFDQYDWLNYPMEINDHNGIIQIPKFTSRHWLLSKRFSGQRVLLTITTHPVLYKHTIDQFLESHLDYFITYFHADELKPRINNWRRLLYSMSYLINNLHYLEDQAQKFNHTIQYSTVGDIYYAKRYHQKIYY